MRTIAQRMTKRMEAEGRRRSKDSIYAVAADEHNIHCLTESHLDVWWESLKPEDKAALYELHLDGILDEEPAAYPASTIRAELAASAIVEDCFITACGADTSNPATLAAVMDIGEAAMRHMRSIQSRSIQGGEVSRA